MAKKKSKKYPYKWPNGEYHSIPWSEAKQNPANKPTGPPKGLKTQTDPESGAAQYYVPGSPGVPRPPIAPFLTGEQMAMDATKQGGWEREIIDIDAELQRLEAQTVFDKAQIDKSAKQSKENVRDNTAAAGWVGSSIQDADLIDIDSTATIRKKFMQTALDNARLVANNRKSAITDEKTAWGKALEQMKVENASGMSRDMGPWLQEPTEGKWVPLGHGQSTEISGFGLKPMNQSYTPQEQFAAERFSNRMDVKRQESKVKTKPGGPPKGQGGNPF